MQIIELNKHKYKPATESQKEEVKKKIKQLQKELDELVTGYFEFSDAQGGWLDFSYRYFPGEPIRTVKILHGEKITIPKLLARHINGVFKKIRVMPENWDKGKTTFTKTSRCKFIPLDMFDGELLIKAT